MSRHDSRDDNINSSRHNINSPNDNINSLRQQLLMMHGIAWYCMVLHGIAWHCMVLHAIPCNTMQYHASLITADGAYHCAVGSIMAIFSSVRSSYSHPNLLLTHPPHPTFSDHTGPQHWTFTF